MRPETAGPPDGAVRQSDILRLLPAAFQEALELVSSRGVTQLAQRLGLDLADPLTGHVELLADFLEGMVGTHLHAKPHAQHLGFARRE